MHTLLSVFHHPGPSFRRDAARHSLRPRALITTTFRAVGSLVLLLAVHLALAPGLQAAPGGTAENTAASQPPVQTVQAEPVAEPSPARPTLMPQRGGIAVGRFMQSLTDPGGKLGIDDILKTGQAFSPLDMRALPREAGVVWLRLPLGRLSAVELGTAQENARLDLGDQVPGTPQVWVRAREAGVPRPVTPDENGLYPLPGLHQGGEAIIRLDGLPGLWFSPALRSPADALNAPERKVHALALATLTVLLMLAFVRSITERGDGRIWAGIFAGAALIQAFWGVPATPEGTIRPLDMPGILAAAIALMLLPHVGRNIMRTRSRAPVIDVLLLVLALPGAALALLPMLPGQAWTARLLSLWPLGALFALIPALVLLLRREKGSFLFSLACFAMAAASLLGLWGMGDDALAPLWGQAPLIGVCIAALLLAAAAPRSAYTEIPASATGLSDGKSPADLLEIEHFGPVEELPPPLEVSLGEVEETLRAPLDRLMRECCALDRGLRLLEEPAEGEQPLPETTLDKVRRSRADAENVLNAATALAGRIARLSLAEEEERPAARDSVFDLRQLVQLAFSAVQNDAAEKNLGLSWYIAPHIALRYRGDGERLSRVLAALLTDAVRATEKGNVCLRVRREERSANPGHLQFTVADTGRGAPPVHRSSLALAHAWELATDHGGDLFVDSTPHGVEISFSLNCTALDAEDRAVAAPPTAPAGATKETRSAEPEAPLIILASDRSLNRQMFAWQLRGDDHETWEARDCAEAVALYKTRPAALLVLDGHMPEDDIIRAVAEVRLFEGENALPLVPVLGLALDAEQGERLRRTGCEYLLYHPLARQELREMARTLLAGEAPAPRLAQPSAAVKKNEEHPVVRSARDTTAITPPEPSASPVASATPASASLKTPPHISAASSAHAAATLPPERATPSDADKPVSASPRAIPRPAPDSAQVSGEAPGQTTRQTTGQRPALSVPSRTPKATAPDMSSPAPSPDPLSAAGQAAASSETPSQRPALRKSGGNPVHTAVLPLAPPPKARGWLSSLFKPKPKLTPQDASVLTSPEGLDEWVGDPVPVRHLPGAPAPDSGLSLALRPDTSSDAPASQSDSQAGLAEGALSPDAPASGVLSPETVPSRGTGTASPLNLNFIPLAPEEDRAETEDARSDAPSTAGASGADIPTTPDDTERDSGTAPIEALPLSSVEAMPFLSMFPGGGEEPLDDNDEIVNLTEDDMVLPGPIAAAERRFAGSMTDGLADGDVPPSGAVEEGSMDALLAERDDALPETASVEAHLSDLAGIREDVRASLTDGDALLLARSAGRLRDCAQGFGLHTLADLAYLLEESAQARDFEAVRLIMPDLDQVVDRELARAAERGESEG